MSIQMRALHGFSGPEGAFLPGDVVTTSPERAKFLETGKYAERITAAEAKTIAEQVVDPTATLVPKINKGA